MGLDVSSWKRVQKRGPSKWVQRLLFPLGPALSPQSLLLSFPVAGIDTHGTQRQGSRMLIIYSLGAPKPIPSPFAWRSKVKICQLVACQSWKPD